MAFFKECMREGCHAIGKYMCAPTDWACKPDSDSSHLPGIAGLLANATSCSVCLKLPCCCLASAVTIPTGIAAGAVFTFFGCTVGPVIDICCDPSDMGPRRQTMR